MVAALDAPRAGLRHNSRRAGGGRGRVGV